MFTLNNHFIRDDLIIRAVIWSANHVLALWGITLNTGQELQLKIEERSGDV